MPEENVKSHGRAAGAGKEHQRYTNCAHSPDDPRPYRETPICNVVGESVQAVLL